MALAVLALVCCRKEDLQPEPELRLPADAGINFTKTPAKYERLSFDANCAWQLAIPEDATWLTASLKSGNPNGVLTKFHILLTAEENNARNPRSTTISLKWGDNQSSDIIVNQAGSPLLHKCSERYITDDMIFSSCCSRTVSSVQQGFNYDPVDNTLFFTQLNRGYRVLLSWTTPSVTTSTTVAQHWMGLRCFSHGNNTFIEKTTNGEMYVWSPNYGTKDSEGKYSNPYIVSRFPLRECKSDKDDIYNTDTEENYYFGIKPCWPAIDFANDLIAICNYSTVKVYRLSTLRALPVTNVTLPSNITYGGMSGTNDSGIAEYTGKPTVKVRDCSKVTPLSTFSNTYSSRGLHWQTFCIANSKAYFLSQADVNEAGPITHDSYIEVYDLMSGKLLHEKVRQEYIQDHAKLAELGYVEKSYCYAEPEGIQVIGDTMYVMYTCRGNNTITTRRPVIFILSSEF